MPYQAIITLFLTFGYVIAVRLFSRKDPPPKRIKKTVWKAEATKVRVKDGDTIECLIRGHYPLGKKEESIRVRHCDTPEKNGVSEKERKLGQKATLIATKELAQAHQIWLYNIDNGSRDKYGRMLADVYYDGKSLAITLKRAGLVDDYEGGKKKDWSK